MTVNRAHTTAALLGAGVALFVASGACEARNVSRQMRVAFASAINFADVPTLMAHRILTQQGYVVTPTFYAQPEVAAEAIVRGDADFVLGSTRVLWAAAVKGAPVVAILQDALDNNVLVAPVAMTSCLELAKGRIGLHSRDRLEPSSCARFSLNLALRPARRSYSSRDLPRAPPPCSQARSMRPCCSNRTRWRWKRGRAAGL